MELTQREKVLIQNALFILECQSLRDEIDYEIQQDLIASGGIPDMDEIRLLTNKMR